MHNGFIRERCKLNQIECRVQRNADSRPKFQMQLAFRSCWKVLEGAEGLKSRVFSRKKKNITRGWVSVILPNFNFKVRLILYQLITGVHADRRGPPSRAYGRGPGGTKVGNESGTRAGRLKRGGAGIRRRSVIDSGGSWAISTAV